MQARKEQGLQQLKSEPTFVHVPMTVGDVAFEIGDFGGTHVLSTSTSRYVILGRSPIAPL